MLVPRYNGLFRVIDCWLRGLSDVPRVDRDPDDVTPYDFLDFGVYDERVLGVYAYFAPDAYCVPIFRTRVVLPIDFDPRAIVSPRVPVVAGTVRYFVVPLFTLAEATFIRLSRLDACALAVR